MKKFYNFSLLYLLLIICHANQVVSGPLFSKPTNSITTKPKSYYADWLNFTDENIDLKNKPYSHYKPGQELSYFHLTNDVQLKILSYITTNDYAGDFSPDPKYQHRLLWSLR